MVRKAPAVHTVPNSNGGWKVKQGGQTLSTHRTKENALQAGRKVAISDSTEHVIHNKDGKISDSNSYGHDPHPPNG